MFTTLIKQGFTLANTKRLRDKKKQLGQYMTPAELSQRIVLELELTEKSLILEPSFGNGSFLFAVIERLLELGSGTREEKLQRIFTQQLYGAELDPELFHEAIHRLETKYGKITGHNLQQNDFFRTAYRSEMFDFVVGNPPFGGTFDADIEDSLDRQYGNWSGYNIKKETYSFFIARSLDLLKHNGVLCFISSDTFLTINTMVGLRQRLVNQTAPKVRHLNYFSEETQYNMVVLLAKKSGKSSTIEVDEKILPVEKIAMTDNFSWQISEELTEYFSGPKLKDYVICTGGMTIGKNEYFVRELEQGNTFFEPYNFEFFEDPITLQKEQKKARLGKISPKKVQQILQLEQKGETRRNVRVVPKKKPQTLHFPHGDYKLYNKADKSILYGPPRSVIYWKDNGDAVLTFKKNGNWYLHGVGGKKFFEREGLTWHLISSRIKMRYLPPGYILDSGAPCAFLREGIDRDELFLILGWTLTTTANTILKTVINHTRNIQGKDVERLPYPWWITKNKKKWIIAKVKKMLQEALEGRIFCFSDGEFSELEKAFHFPEKVPFHENEKEETFPSHPSERAFSQQTLF